MNKLIFKCIMKDADGVISDIGVYDEKGILSDSSGKLNYKQRTKSDLLTVINELNDDNLQLVTADGTKVNIVKGKFFRTDGDSNTKNDLLDLPICSNIMK